MKIDVLSFTRTVLLSLSMKCSSLRDPSREADTGAGRVRSQKTSEWGVEETTEGGVNFNCRFSDDGAQRLIGCHLLAAWTPRPLTAAAAAISSPPIRYWSRLMPFPKRSDYHFVRSGKCSSGTQWATGKKSRLEAVASMVFLGC